MQQGSEDPTEELPSLEEEIARARTFFQTLSRSEQSKFLGFDLDAYEIARQIKENPVFLELCRNVEANGHRFWRLKQASKDHDLEFYTMHKLGQEKLAALLTALNAQNFDPLPEPISLGQGSCSRCSECGEVVELLTDGRAIRAVTVCQCPPEGPIEFELNVPSGRIAYADSLWPLFDVFGYYDIDSRLGLIQKTLAMAKIGCAYGCVGNSCPGIYRVDENTIVIASVPTDENTGKPINPPGEEVGGITTDLWWYSIVDADEYVRRGGKEEDRVDRLAVKPGVYKFSHNLRKDDRYGQTFIFATITWVREPDPVQDYLKEFREASFTAGQVIAHEIKRRPRLYGTPDGIMEAANQILDGGGDWHPNGFVQFDPDMGKDTPDLEIPKFDKPFRWNPLSDSSAICVAAGLGQDGEEGRIHLNPSFVALARNVLECMITHGTIPPNIPGWKEKGDPNLELAKKCLEKINQLYPAV